MKKKWNLKTIITIVFTMLLLSSLGLAAWKFRLDSQQITGHATSQRNGMVQIQKEFDDINIIDTTNHSVTFNTWAIVKNNNGNLTFILNMTEIRDDFDDECTDYLNDVSTTYKWNGEDVNNGDSVTLNSGLNYLNMTAIAVMQSCPQNLSISWSLI